MRVKCLAQEHNTVSAARARTWSARSGVERTNHETTAPPVTADSRLQTGGKIQTEGKMLPFLSQANLSII